MAYITFTDTTGAAQLDNGLRSVGGGVASRFRNWLSAPNVIGPRRHTLASGTPHVFRFRTDYLATFEIGEIPVASVAIVDRLIEHLERGGTCAVYTEDLASRSYATCALAPETRPEKQYQPNGLYLALRLTLLNVAGSPTAMLCIYET